MTEMYEEHWYAMRDLKRSNAKEAAYMLLQERQFSIFTPMVQRVVTIRGRKSIVDVPFMRDLLFVKSSRNVLDSIVERIPKLQYRYLRGGKYKEPMTVRDADMERFIFATRSTLPYRYYTLDEVSPAMYGRKISIVGGPLDGFQGRLMTTRGSKVKRLIVELEGFLAVGVEVQSEFIQIVR